MERASSPDTSNSVSGSSRNGSKRKADEDLGDDHRLAKRKRTLPVATADGHLPLKKTWEMTELSNRRGLLAKFRALIRLVMDKKLERLVNWEDQTTKSKQKAKKAVQDFLKEKPYEVDLADYFRDVDAVLAIAFQIAIHNRRKHAKSVGVDLPASQRRGQAKQTSLHQGDGAQGVSTAEIIEKKRRELEERRRKKRDETTDESETETDEGVTGEQRRPGDNSADPVVRTPPPARIKKVAPPPKPKAVVIRHLQRQSAAPPSQPTTSTRPEGPGNIAQGTLSPSHLDEHEHANDQHAPMPPKKTSRKGKGPSPLNTAPKAPKAPKPAPKLTLTIAASRTRRHPK